MNIINKITNKAVWASAVALFAFGCTAENPLVYDGPELFHFTGTTAPYFVEETNDPGFEVELGVTTAASADRNFTISVVEEESTAIEGVHYTLSSTSVTIPAGAFVGSVMLQGDFDQLGIDGPQTLVFQLSDGETSADFNTTYEVTLQQFCPYVQSDFVGTATVTSTLFGATFPVNVVAGSDASVIILEDVYSDADIEVNMDDSNPANFVARINSTVGWVSGTYGDVTVDNAISGSFSACNGTISLVLSHCVSAGCYPNDNLTIVMN